MLRPYPIEATADNWLHECLVDAVKKIHVLVDAKKSPKDWKDCIPKKRQKTLTRYTSIHDKLIAYAKALKKLKPDERELALAILEEQNCIPSLLTCEADCRDMNSLPKDIRSEAKELFYSGFKALTGLGIRDKQYDVAYKSLDSAECPFCGIEYFDSPMRVADDVEFDAAPREDLDHYLALKHYSFAGCNLQNLVPTCKKCNSRYKHEADVLRGESGVRRKSFLLYVEQKVAEQVVSISLNESIPFGGESSPLPAWRLTFEPEKDETSTWDSVFHVRERYIRDVLTQDTFVRWLGCIGKWCNKRSRTCESVGEIVQVLDEIIDDLELMDLKGREKLRIPVFQMLKTHCEKSDKRLVDLLCSYANQRVHDSVDDKESATV